MEGFVRNKKANAELNDTVELLKHSKTILRIKRTFTWLYENNQTSLF